MDGQESCYIDRNSITPSCNDGDENVDEISDIEQNVQIISNQNTMIIINLCLYPEINLSWIRFEN